MLGVSINRLSSRVLLMTHTPADELREMADNRHTRNRQPTAYCVHGQAPGVVSLRRH